MTNVNTHVEEQTSRFNGAVVGAFSAAITVLAAILTFATFVTV
jgi:hypothetical protein